jgi:hypothetical protein
MLPVIAGVSLIARVPLDLLTEDRPAVDDGRDLHVGSAEVESDTAAVEVPAKGLMRLVGLRDVGWGGGHEVEGPLINLFAHELGVEGARSAWSVAGLEVLGDPSGADTYTASHRPAIAGT